jgi:hypothetical protein
MFLGAPVALELLTQMFQSVMFSTDIVMPVEDVPQFSGSRLVMSHEYGHYLLCAMMDDEDTGAVGEIVFHAVVSGEGNNRSLPVRYVNEAFADLVAGQVAGGANYRWLETSEEATFFNRETLDEHYCVPAPAGTQPYACFDANLREITQSNEELGTQSVGRIVTLLHDMVDGHGKLLTETVPNDAGLWENYRIVATPEPIESNEGFLRLHPYDDDGDGLPLPNGYGSTDGHLERVALPGSALQDFAKKLAKSLEDEGGDGLQDSHVYTAVNDAMKTGDANWCDRCRVLALHSPMMLAADPTVKDLLQHCLIDPMMVDVLGETPPEPHGRLNADDCTPCPPGHVSGETGQCEPCLDGVVHANSCDVCSVDRYLDGATMSIQLEHVFDTSEPFPVDSCPEVFSVAVQNPGTLVTRGGALAVYLSPMPHTQPNCERFAALTVARDVSGGGVYSPFEALGSAGTWACSATCACEGLPSRGFTNDELTAEVGFLFSVEADAQRQFVVSAIRQTGPL